jgi:hypothetical protein
MSTQGVCSVPDGTEKNLLTENKRTRREPPKADKQKQKQRKNKSYD